MCIKKRLRPFVRNIRLTIEYEGTGYCGWQVQNCSSWLLTSGSIKSIQETIEKALQKLLQERIKVIAQGRTDAGVHAQGQVANFKTKSRLGCKNIQKGANSLLPEDIRVSHVKDVPCDFHARFSTRSKIYRYTIVNDSFAPAHLRFFCHLVKYPLDVKKMRRGARYLLGKHNFRSFQAQDKKERHPVRTIKRLDIRKNKNFIYVNIEADGFLYRMVRNIVGTLIEVGRGKLRAQDIKGILEAKDRIYAGPCAPAKGLCLMEVKY